MTKNIIEWGSNIEYTIPMATYLTNAGYYANMQGSIADGSILSLEDNVWIDYPGLDGGPDPLFDNTTPANSFYDQDQFVDYCEFVLGQLDWLVIFNQYYNFWSNTTFGSGVLNSLYIDALRQMRLDMGLK